MRIMTLNIWGDYFNNPVGLRKDAIVDTVKKYSPDVVGFQEMTANWYKSEILDDLTEYNSIGFKKNYVPLLFKAEVFELIECGYIPYAETPDISKGITWAVLLHKGTSKLIGVCNTHLWWKIGEDHDQLRAKNADQLYKKMKSLKESFNTNVIAFGDFNAKDGSPAMQLLEEKNFYSSYKLAEKFSEVCSWHGNPVADSEGKYHGKPSLEVKEHSYDHIIAEKDELIINNQCVVTDQQILDATDHSPVYIDIDF